MRRLRAFFHHVAVLSAAATAVRRLSPSIRYYNFEAWEKKEYKRKLRAKQKKLGKARAKFDDEEERRVQAKAAEKRNALNEVGTLTDGPKLASAVELVAAACCELHGCGPNTRLWPVPGVSLLYAGLRGSRSLGQMLVVREWTSFVPFASRTRQHLRLPASLRRNLRPTQSCTGWTRRRQRRCKSKR